MSKQKIAPVTGANKAPIMSEPVQPTESGAPVVVLVHGAFADASGFTGVIRDLTAAGHRVVAVPNPLRGLAGDAAVVHAVAGEIHDPVLLVGHSYGGAVITQASAGLDNVAGLVYLAAFGLDESESCADLTATFPPSMLAETIRSTSYEAHDAAGGPDLYIDVADFHESYCADLPVELALAMSLTQRPIAAAAFAEQAAGAGWKSIPSWYQIARHDNALSPQAQRFMADRMGAITEEVDGSHVAFIAQPRRTADLIEAALSKL
ncbi:alpha/beta fold hydrolase [Nocardia sp. NPDC127579]|uniref:alpha/beta fold hydrolase n=1 Tax=Nocardia sp. NPDC127579 TaxID=3345402 RepID=UPI00363E2C88